MNKKSIILFSIGIVFLLFSACLTGYNLVDQQRAYTEAEKAVIQLEKVIPETTEAVPDYKIAPEKEMPSKKVENHEYVGLLEIPCLDLKLPVISRWSYENLKSAPCVYSGTAYNGNLVIAAHNYSSHFGNLKKIPLGEEIIYTDMEGNVFRYRAQALEKLSSTSVNEMKSDDWDMTLFTCTFDGQSRVALRCLKDFLA